MVALQLRCGAILLIIELAPSMEEEEEEDMMFEILKHDKIWGTICISVSYSKLLGGLLPVICSPAQEKTVVQMNTAKLPITCNMQRL